MPAFPSSSAQDLSLQGEPTPLPHTQPYLPPSLTSPLYPPPPFPPPPPLCTRYAISPKEDINFGALVLNTRPALSLSIENKGEFDFRYAITRITASSNGEGRQRGSSIPPPSFAPGASKRARSRESIASSSGRVSQMTKMKRPEGLR